jgi:hypothetical protein
MDRDLLLIGPVGHRGVGWPEVAHADEAVLPYKGFHLVARARKGPVGWLGEVRIILAPARLPVHVFAPVPRFHMDPGTAVREALIEGIRKVDRGEIIGL